MSRPTTKTDLLASANTEFEKLWALIDSMSMDAQKASFQFEDRDKNIRDVLMHLSEWHKLVESWHREGTLEGGMPAVPGEGYTWKTLPEFNQKLWERIQGVPLSKAKTLLKKTHLQTLNLIESHTNDELFKKSVYPWTKSSTLGAYFVSCTSSHYVWAMKKIRKHKKASQENVSA
ncbi:MAG: ClbS/DfsB family four-helix bundle protein [Reinekea sp.]|nr:ClbS/DfsB family four-helix bundle protein [Reinekea sp.]